MNISIFVAAFAVLTSCALACSVVLLRYIAWCPECSCIPALLSEALGKLGDKERAVRENEVSV